jgi:hypothetical protein
MKSRLGEPTLAHALEIILFQSNVTLKNVRKKAVEKLWAA